MAERDKENKCKAIVPYRAPRPVFGACELGLIIALAPVVACVGTASAWVAVWVAAAMPLALALVAVAFGAGSAAETRAASLLFLSWAWAYCLEKLCAGGLPEDPGPLLPVAVLAAWCVAAAVLEGGLTAGAVVVAACAACVLLWMSGLGTLVKLAGPLVAALMAVRAFLARLDRR